MRIVCAALPGAGHAYPMAAVARALSARGHEVTLLSGRQHEGDASAAGASFQPLPITPGSSLRALRPYEDAAHQARALEPVLERLSPEVAVVDLITLGAALALERASVPYASLVIHPLHTPSRALPPFGWGFPAARGLMRARDAWMRRGNARDLNRARADLNVARGSLGLARTERLDGTLSEHLVLVATLPALEVPRPDWPERAHVIGPCLWSRDEPVPDLPEGQWPFVLIAPTTSHDPRALIEAGAPAAASVGATPVVTASARSRVPGGTVELGITSHDALLPRCAAVVCSGGHGIVARALTHGVPLVVAPAAGDQRENGYRVERAGAGLRVLRLRGLARALRRVLTEPSFTHRAREIASEAAALDGPARAADLVERMGRALPARPAGHIVTDG